MRNEPCALRRILLALLLLSLVGLGGELLLLEHTEGFWQLVPVILFGLGILAVLVRVASPGRTAMQVLGATMLLFVVAGLAGLYLHYRGNVEFELEMKPPLAGLELFWKAMGGATPALAPAAMTQIGILGLAYCFRHPLAKKVGHDTEGPTGPPGESRGEVQ